MVLVGPTGRPYCEDNHSQPHPGTHVKLPVPVEATSLCNVERKQESG